MSARRVVSQHIENDSNLDPDTKDDVLDKIGRMTASTILTYAGDLTVWSQQGYEGTNTLKIMTDTATQCFLPFENGVIVVSKDEKGKATRMGRADALQL